jgi:hypothetical protein
MAFEYKRYLTAMEEASETIVQNTLGPDDEEDNTCHGDHIERTKAIHAVTRVMSSMFWEDYLIRGLGEMLTLHRVDSQHRLIRKGPERRSQFETYTASLRSLFQGSTKSYIMKILFPSYALEDLQVRIDIVIAHINEILKYAESTSAVLEEYLTWVDHGSKLAAAYMNALLPNSVTDENGDEVEPDQIEPSDLYNDVRIKAYALLKLSDYSAPKMASYIQSVDGLMCAADCIVDIVHRLYATMDPKAFENIFNAMVSKKNRAPNYEGTKFENIHELNEYIRQRMKESVEEPHGFMYNVNELLEESRSFYIDKLATEIIEVLAFLPDKKEQKRFVSQFESGKIWLSASLGE